MGFFSRLAPRHRPKHFIAIDVGSDSAIRSLVVSEGYGKPELLTKQFFKLPMREEDSDIFPLVNEYLRRLLFQYLKEIGQVPGEVVIGLGNRFTFNEMAVIERTRPERDTPINSREIQELVDTFLTKHREKVIGGETYSLVHVMPFSISVDGYIIPAVKPRTKGKNLELSVLATYAVKEYWQKLWQLKSILGGLKLSFVSSQATVAGALVSVLKVSDALIVKIGAQTTEVSLIGSGTILSTGRFEFGGDHVTAAIAKRTGMTLAEAERLKVQWGETTPPKATSQAIAEAIQESTELWVKHLVDFLTSEERFTLPKTLYLFGGGAKLAAIHHVLATTSWYSELTFLEDVEVHELKAEDIASEVLTGMLPGELSGSENVVLVALVSRLLARPSL